MLIGLNDSKELCYLHTTNIIAEETLLEATKLAQAKCIERAIWIKELASKYIEDRDIPLYERVPGSRTTGAVFSISDAELNLPCLNNCISFQPSKSTNSKSKINPKKYATLPTINSTDIKVLEEMAV